MKLFVTENEQATDMNLLYNLKSNCGRLHYSILTEFLIFLIVFVFLNIIFIFFLQKSGFSLSLAVAPVVADARV